jgi:hypothetical protein
MSWRVLLLSRCAGALKCSDSGQGDLDLPSTLLSSAVAFYVPSGAAVWPTRIVQDSDCSGRPRGAPSRPVAIRLQ